MKKSLLFAAIAATALSAQADWGTFEQPLAVFPQGTTIYGESVSAGKNVTWTVIYRSSIDINPDDPDAGSDVDKSVYSYVLQGVRSDGTLVFPEGGKVIADYDNLSFTMFNNYVFTDRDDNAIVAAIDLRNSDRDERKFSIYLYKVSPDGEMLWGEDGLSPDGEKTIMNLTATTFGQLSDGSYVVSYEGSDGNSAMSALTTYVQRISPDGAMLYGDTGIEKPWSFPIMVPSTDNQIFIVYCGGGGLQAMKLDVDGSDAWSKPVQLFTGTLGAGQTPAYATFGATEGIDGGLLAYWYGYTSGDGTLTYPYLSHVTYDGDLSFKGASDEGYCQLAWEENWHAVDVKAIAAPDGEGFIAGWTNNYASSNGQGGTAIQRVSLDGELLWGEDCGMPVCEPAMEDVSSIIGLCPDDKGNVGIFFDRGTKANGQNPYSSHVSKLRLIDQTSGDPIWDEDVILTEADWSSNEFAFSMPEKNMWYFTWAKGRNTSYDEYAIRARGVNFDGTLTETVGIESVAAENGGMSVKADKGLLNVFAPKATEASVVVYGMDGRVAASLLDGTLREGNTTFTVNVPAGVYVVAVSTPEGDLTCKFVK